MEIARDQHADSTWCTAVNVPVTGEQTGVLASQTQVPDATPL
jgi:predicted RNA-binding protein with PUA domain